MEGSKGTGLTEKAMDEVFVALSQYQQEIASVIARALSDAYRRGFEDGKKQQQCGLDQSVGEKCSQRPSESTGTSSSYGQTTGNDQDWQGGGEPDSSGRE